ncbi:MULTISPECIES: polysaccharide deacetylase family protein [Arthrobacter]|uniref:Polysaccharide deacetylase n=1 Tax=Arthrobacter terricola TaxID=2547396 RepID=A0A4R5KE82_9MICC|nr:MULTISPECIES: polysaccharide deacetylase family protein [Arthrobacter]MBT8159721.1 polysaccharide deacetylase family protein [Arthrobacter sp. GN70]TDF93669.1 polysaccharide deacetylase [Arthrobacter terricola]
MAHHCRIDTNPRTICLPAAPNGTTPQAAAEGTHSEVSRRSVLLAAGAATIGAIVAGCGFPTPDTSAPTTSPKARQTPAAKAAAATNPKALPTAPVQPSRSDIERRFTGKPPGRWGLDLPGIVTHTGSSAIALTFDACGGAGGSGYDARLIETLRRFHVPATLFLNARWITSNPSLSRELASDSLFEIGNHGLAHVPLSTTGRSAYGIAGTSSVDAVMDEVSGGVAGLAALTGKKTPWLRAGTAFYDETAVQVVGAMGLVPVNFSINSDGGPRPLLDERSYPKCIRGWPTRRGLLG